MAEPRQSRVVALWAFDKTERYPPQFVGAVAGGLRDAWWEEGERIRELAQEWFVDFGDDDRDHWSFRVAHHGLTAPEVSDDA